MSPRHPSELPSQAPSGNRRWNGSRGTVAGSPPAGWPVTWRSCRKRRERNHREHPSADPASAGIEVRHATPGDADAIAALFDRVYQGGYHLTECTDPELVRRTVASREHLWVLTLRRRYRRRLRHGPARSRQRQLRAGPSGRRPGLPGAGGHRRRVGGAAARHGQAAGLRAALRFPAVGQALRRFGWEAVGCCWTGADGGMHVLMGEREEHLFGMAFNPGRTVTRIAPGRSACSQVARWRGRSAG